MSPQGDRGLRGTAGPRAPCPHKRNGGPKRALGPTSFGVHPPCGGLWCGVEAFGGMSRGAEGCAGVCRAVEWVSRAAEGLCAGVRGCGGSWGGVCCFGGDVQPCGEACGRGWGRESLERGGVPPPSPLHCLYPKRHSHTPTQAPTAFPQ